MESFCKAEMLVIERHRARLQHECGYAIALEDAIEDWVENHADHWRAIRQSHMMAMQREAINDYKWLASEEAKCDLGREAVLSWIQENAAEWRRWFEEEYEVKQCNCFLYERKMGLQELQLQA